MKLLEFYVLCRSLNEDFERVSLSYLRHKITECILEFRDEQVSVIHYTGKEDKDLSNIMKKLVKTDRDRKVIELFENDDSGLLLNFNHTSLYCEQDGNLSIIQPDGKLEITFLQPLSNGDTSLNSFSFYGNPPFDVSDFVGGALRTANNSFIKTFINTEFHPINISARY